MRKVFDILLIAAILLGVAYACSSDYMETYEESLVYNAYDPREELILITDSIPLESSVETLAIGENINSGGKNQLIADYISYKNTIISLYVTVHTEFYIDSLNKRRITYAEASLPYTLGEKPDGSRFACVPQVPNVKIIRSVIGDDYLMMRTEVYIDYGDYFVPGDDRAETRYYEQKVNPF